MTEKTKQAKEDETPIDSVKAAAAKDWNPDHPFYGYAHNVKGPDCKAYPYAQYLTDMGHSLDESPVNNEAAIADLHQQF